MMDGMPDPDLDPPAAPTGPDLVESLRRWEDLGAVWRVLRREGARVTIGLFRCDGGEEADRFTSDAPELRDFVAGRLTDAG
jgi:hypothetical protein